MSTEHIDLHYDIILWFTVILLVRKNRTANVIFYCIVNHKILQGITCECST